MACREGDGVAAYEVLAEYPRLAYCAAYLAVFYRRAALFDRLCDDWDVPRSRGLQIQAARAGKRYVDTLMQQCVSAPGGLTPEAARCARSLGTLRALVRYRFPVESDALCRAILRKKTVTREYILGLRSVVPCAGIYSAVAVDDLPLVRRLYRMCRGCEYCRDNEVLVQAVVDMESPPTLRWMLKEAGMRCPDNCKEKVQQLLDGSPEPPAYTLRLPPSEANQNPEEWVIVPIPETPTDDGVPLWIDSRSSWPDE